MQQSSLAALKGIVCNTLIEMSIGIVLSIIIEKVMN